MRNLYYLGMGYSLKAISIEFGGGSLIFEGLRSIYIHTR